ncbi:CDP-glucose 4,6-dehydratase [Bdellovibrio bacteriovorus]|uniref:CDP-glucose 4,6-dehydratase n=1 Tax=Bdellovibrio bacteriovorus TaxID=959 RepID=A0A150WLC9_BDEBC|nr:CDP-glucose 4,6-dehydratase [Bdellovibrio bacteriovorus]KYG64738.1 CDP-glucose 4,6-dehydratase [Bdellovibrio bacteriovorus]
MSFENIYKGKKVVVTGNTGFKGSWLTVWLLSMGADVVGISCDIPSNPSLFETLKLRDKIKHYEFDLLERDKVYHVIHAEKPDFVFHLAAQAIVSKSYQDPIRTLQSNVMGTAHVLDVLRDYPKKCVAVMITSDKCYENVEWCWGYKETDHLGGKDIYSASKAAAENVIHSYVETFFKKEGHPVVVASARAGNVIGGGDWAADRIVADIARAWAAGEKVAIRSPKATRPWQHVLEPLSGYLELGKNLYKSQDFHGQAYNFGPRAEQNRTVVDLLIDMSMRWGFESSDKAYEITDNRPFNEAGLLKLNCDKALFDMKWQATLGYYQTVHFVVDWYSLYYKEKGDMFAFTSKQITEYVQLAKKQNIEWAARC